MSNSKNNNKKTSEKAKLMSKWQKMPYTNRELSWVDFNARVLEEAFKKTNPIMERCNFLSITASNLDEFFMVRVAGVLDQIHHGRTSRDASGMTPTEVMDGLVEKIHEFAKKQYSCYNRSIIPSLRSAGIVFKEADELDGDQKAFVEEYFEKVVFPVLTPMAVDTSRPFPMLANKSLNIAVRLTNAENEEFFALVQVPSILPRFLELPTHEGRAFILLEKIIAMHLGELFELYNIKQYDPFRITRDSDLDIDEDTEDLMAEIKKSIRKRKRGEPVRLEFGKKCNREIREFLVDALDVTEREIYFQRGPLDLTFLSKFAHIKGCEDMCFEPIVPVNPPAEFCGYDDIFEAIREKDRLVHHPYESFDVVVDFVKKAATDPNVLAIKQTLYRVSGNSPIVAALIKAAENGKQVTVLVELKARFDEENNIGWSKKMEEAGVKIIYGLDALKVHSKLLLITRKQGSNIRYYTQIGTGNYNEKTSRLYTDLTLMTSDKDIGADASTVFNALSLGTTVESSTTLLVAPKCLKSRIVEMIDNEITYGTNGYIGLKMNSLTDKDIIDKLIEASCQGVKIELIIRGICCLIAGVPGYTENISVISIVGRFLEHSRIYIFGKGERRKVYISSADFMTRNTERRVEVAVPLKDKIIADKVVDIFNTMLKDNVKALSLIHI